LDTFLIIEIEASDHTVARPVLKLYYKVLYSFNRMHNIIVL